MKIISTVKLLSFVMVSMLTLNSCLESGDDDKKDDPTPDPEPEINCAVTSITNLRDGGESIVAYNEKGYATTVTTTGSGSTSVSTYIYDSNNRMVKEEIKLNGELQEYNISTYTNGLESKREWFDASGQSKRYQTYSFDGNGHVTEWNRYTGSNEEKGVLTYRSDGNLAKQTVYLNGKLSTILTYEDYDDNKYYQTAIKGLRVVGVSANKNNYRKLTQVFWSNNETITREFFYDYTYNEYGYPIREIETFEGEQYIYDFTYECK